MEKDKFLDVIENINDKSNKDLFLVINEVYEEFNKTKSLIVDLTRHMDNLEKVYNEVNKEIGKRIKK